MNDVFAHLLNATTVRRVIDLVIDIEKDHRVLWRPVGDRENNLATINLGSDPAAGLIERITNAIDAVLEKEWVQRGEPTNIRSPREASDIWFGITDGRLENIKNPRDPQIADLSRKVQITLHDSENPERPTVDVRDFGIGLRTQDFASSILGLNETRKLKKFFLAGAFGQGGSTALSYPLFTIIVSRRIDSDSKLYPTAATIVRFNPGDPETDKHGVYEYMVDQRNGSPFEFEIPEAEFPAGTLVRHVAMELGKFNKIMTAPVNSLWYLSHHYLFDPVLPFRIDEQRQNTSKGENRFVGGNHRRLTTGEKTEYQMTAIRTFRSGSIIISWWVLSATGEDSRNVITNFCLPSKPIIITYNGQKQGEMPNTVIKNDLKLPYLERYLIVHVDCDQLDSESRRQLFPTTRESLRDTALLDDLRQLVIETLAGDDNLLRLDRDRKQKYIQRSESASVENLRRRLANRINQVLTVGGKGKSPRIPESPPTPNSPKTPIPVQEPPTFLEITSPNPREVYSGRTFILRFRTDAEPSYFGDPDAFIAIIEPPAFGQYTGTTRVHDGYGTAYFKAKEGMDADSTAEITLELRPKRAKTLKSSVTVKIIPAPEDVGDQVGESKTPNIRPQWITADDPFWKEYEWDEESVALVIQEEDSVDIFVSAENKRLTSLIARAQRRDRATVDALKDLYLEHISFHALLADIVEQKTVEKGNGSDADPEKNRERELKRATETVCGMLNQMFDFIATQASASSKEE
jgi:hypothetical protein